jgi:hypothetical protein
MMEAANAAAERQRQSLEAVIRRAQGKAPPRVQPTKEQIQQIFGEKLSADSPVTYRPVTVRCPKCEQLNILREQLNILPSASARGPGRATVKCFSCSLQMEISYEPVADDDEDFGDVVNVRYASGRSMVDQTQNTSIVPRLAKALTLLDPDSKRWQAIMRAAPRYVDRDVDLVRRFYDAKRPGGYVIERSSDWQGSFAAARLYELMTMTTRTSRPVTARDMSDADRVLQFFRDLWEGLPPTRSSGVGQRANPPAERSIEQLLWGPWGPPKPKPSAPLDVLNVGGVRKFQSEDE